MGKTSDCIKEKFMKKKMIVISLIGLISFQSLFAEQKSKSTAGGCGHGLFERSGNVIGVGAVFEREQL